MTNMKLVFGLYLCFCVAFALREEPATEPDVFDAFQGEDLEGDVEKYLYQTENSLDGCEECSCPPTPQCEPGVSLIMDGCGCCRVCAAQLGEQCGVKSVCDHHKGLHCDKSTGTCKAKPGRSCQVANKWYDNGAMFSPTCRLACSCIDGDMGCVSKCRPAPPGCHYPKLVRSSSNCCGQWRCSSRPHSQFGRGMKSSVGIRGPCMVQTTDWSPCTKTCGFGVSERVTNNRENCKLTKETRLCIVRPCKGNTAPRKTKRSCRKSLRHSKRIRYSVSGCSTTKTYRPKYCGTCRHPGKCCKPQVTRTIDVEFRCVNPDGSVLMMSRKMAAIQSCECGNFCSANENDIFSNSIRFLGGDVLRSLR